MPSIVLLAVWKNFGYNMIILMAALQAIPEDLHEAARSMAPAPGHGCATSRCRCSRPTLVLVGIVTVSGYFQLFAEPYVMTQGGPLQSTVSVLYFMFEQGFKLVEPGLRLGVAFVLFALILLLTTLQLRLTRAWRVMRMKQRTASWLVNGTLWLRRCLTLFPLLWMVSVSLMPTGSFRQLPAAARGRRTPRFDHYRELFAAAAHGALSLQQRRSSQVSATLLALLFNGMAGYAFAKLRFRGREALYRLLLAGLIVPAQVTMIPLFGLLKLLGLVNSYAGAIVPGVASIFGIFLVRQYALSIPDELLDAARIDGASEWRIFRSVVVPVLAPILVTLGIFVFLGTWNDFMWPLIVLTDRDMQTLPVALAGMSREHVQDNELMMAGAVVTVLPVLLLFLAMQRYYLRGIMARQRQGLSARHDTQAGALVAR